MDFIRQLQTLFETYNWQNPSWGLFVLGFWVVGSLIYAFSAGRGRIMSILVSIFMSKLLILEAPFLGEEIGKKLPASALAAEQLIAFLVLFFLIFVFLSRYAFRSSADGRSLTAIPFSIVFSFLQVGLLINIVLSLLPQPTREGFDPLVQFIFLQNGANFFWLVTPIIFLVVLGRFVGGKDD